MFIRISAVKYVFSIFATLLIFCSLSSAQTNWLDIRDFERISITGSKVSLESGAPDLSFLTSIWYVSGNVPASDKISIVFDVPIAYIKEDYSGSESEFIIGNPYIGIEAGERKEGHYSFFGLRLPIAPDDKPSAEIFGTYTHFDRAEAFLPNLFSVSAGAGYRGVWPSGAGMFGEGGGTFWVPTEDNGDPEFLLNYKFGFRYRTEQAGFTWCFKGRMLITESDLNIGERSFHKIGFSADIRWGEVYPGLRVTVPIDDDLSGFYNLVYGLSLTIRLGEEGSSSSRSEW